MSNKPKILLVDDEKLFYDQLRKQLDKFYTLIYAPSAVSAEKAMINNFDLILLDLVLDESKGAKEGGLKLIKILKQYKPKTPVIIVTKYNDTGNVVDAMKLGAIDFFWKETFDMEEWKKKIDSNLKQEFESNLVKDRPIIQGKPFIGESEAILQIKKILGKLSKRPDVTILITGETGVGKEVAAQYLHSNGIRYNRPFKAVNLSTLTEDLMESRLFGHKKGAFTDARRDSQGIFEQAHEGILFLDEIGEIGFDLQVKLLRFLQEKVITPMAGEDIYLDVQIVAATNKDLKKEVDAGRFREDLYYRLNQFHIEIPPLRKRRDDLKLLLEYYLKKEGESEDILTQETKGFLLSKYPWPGNIRELVNWVKSVCLKRDLLELDKIDDSLWPDNTLEKKDLGLPQTPATKVNEYNTTDVENYQANLALEELKPIEVAFIKYGGKKQPVAEEFGKSLDTLRYLIKKHHNNHPEIFENLPTITKKYKL